MSYEQRPFEKSTRNKKMIGNIVADIPTKLHISVCLLGLALNCFVLVVIWKDPKKCLRTRSAMFVTSLIVSDLFTTIINIIHLAYNICGFERHIPREIRIVILIGCYDALMISFFTIFLISIEHFLAIIQPIKFKIFVTKKLVSLIIFLTWLGCTTIQVIMFFLPGNNGLFHGIAACCVLLFLALPTMYGRAFFSLRQQSKAIKAADSCLDKSRRQSRISQQRNFLLTSALLVLTYLLTCAPFTFHHYLKTSKNEDYNMREEKDTLAIFLWMTIHLNLFLDPFLYCLRIPQYRSSCAALLCKGSRN